MKNFLNMSVSPHTRAETSTSFIMIDVLIALIPAGVFGVYYFGINAFWTILISVLTCVLTEYIYEKLMNLPITIKDCSSVVTGVLLAYCLPSTVPFWIPIIGGVFAILIVKMLFGGIGQNIMNPALAARCFLLISFGTRLTTYAAVDMLSSATPLAVIKQGGTYDLVLMFLGTHNGCIGETSILALLFGATYLLCKKVISWKIPVTYIASALAFISLFTVCKGSSLSIEFLLEHVCGGGLVLGAFFMATDYVTSPITNTGKIIYGLLLGFLTAAFRILGKSAEGVSYAIIISNLFVPLIEKITVPKPFGYKGGAKNEK